MPYELKIHDNVEEDSLDFVTAFSKETGDLKSLSKTDLRVMALGVQLSKEKGVFDKLNKQPKPLTEFRPKKFQDEYKKVDENNESEDDSSEEESEGEVKK